MQNNKILNELICLIRLECKSLYVHSNILISPIFFALFSIIIFRFTIPNVTSQIDEFYALAYIGCINIFISFILLAYYAKQDMQDGFLLQLRASNISIYVYSIVKYLVVTVISLIFVLTTQITAYLLYNFANTSFFQLFIKTCSCVLPIISILLLLSWISEILQKSFIVFLLALPFIAPLVMLLGMSYQISNFSYNKILLGIWMIYLGVYTLITPKILRL